MTDEEIDALVQTIGKAMHGVIDDVTMREGDRALAALVADTLKKLNRMTKAVEEIAEAQRVIAKATALSAATARGGLSP